MSAGSARKPPGREERPRARPPGSPNLWVRAAAEELLPWDRRILVAKVRGLGVPTRQAQAVALRVELQVGRAGIAIVPASLVSELLAAELMAAGLVPEQSRPATIPLRLTEVDRLVRRAGQTGDTAGIDPELTGALIARKVKTEYALAAVFSPAVAEAHLRGDIYLQGLGEIERPALVWLTLEALQKAGLKLSQGGAAAAPARRPEVLAAHLAQFSAALHGHISGPVGWDGLNLSFAPYLVGLDRAELRQLAQLIFFELSRPCTDRRHADECCRIALHGGVPRALAGVEALGPGGQPTGKRYGDFAEEALEFALALFEVYAEGDACGARFRSVRPYLVIDQDLFRKSGHRELLRLAGEAARRRGGVSFLFPRGGRVGALEDYGPTGGAGRRAVPGPAAARGGVALQVLTINLPRLGYLAAGKATEIEDYLEAVLDLAAQAHMEKRVYVEGLMAAADKGPLGLLASGDGRPLVALDEAIHVIAPAGLSELTRLVTGLQLGDDPEARRFATSLLGALTRRAAALGRRFKLRFRSGFAADPAAATRFAQLDLRYHGETARRWVLGDVEKGAVSYTPGTGLAHGAALSLSMRARIEGELSKPLDLPCPTRVDPRELDSDPARLAEVLMEVYARTDCREVAVESRAP